MGKAYYFVKRSGNNQCGSEYARTRTAATIGTRWRMTNERG